MVATTMLAAGLIALSGGGPGARSAKMPACPKFSTLADSTVVACLAEEAIRKRGATLPMTVALYRREGDSVLVELLPRPLQDSSADVIGGGGLVRILKTGKVKVLEYYR